MPWKIKKQLWIELIKPGCSRAAPVVQNTAGVVKKK